METIELQSKCGKWENIDWYLLSSKFSKSEIFYCPTLRISMLINDSLSESLREGNLPSAIREKLNKRKNNPITPIIERPKAFHLSIGLSNNCTLGCLYCHADANKETTISKSVVDSAIDYSFQEAGKTPKRMLTVSFAVGGEPTMDWRLFTYTVNKIREFEKIHHYNVDKVYLSMTTNCYYGLPKRKFVAENFDTLTLSIDGYPEIQDSHRPNRSSKGSSSVVEETCKYFVDHGGVRVGVRATVTKSSVNYLTEIVDYFSIKFGNNYSVTFEPMVQIGRALNNALQSPSETEFAINLWKAKKRGEEIGIQVSSSGSNIKNLIGRYCGAMSIPSFTVCTDGTVTACHRDQDGKDYGYGFIDELTGFVQISEEKIKSNILKSELPESCNSCFAKFHCAGDCPDLRRINFSRCNFNRYMIYKQLEELLLKKINYRVFNN